MNQVEIKPKTLNPKWIFISGSRGGGKTHYMREMMNRFTGDQTETEDITFEDVTNLLPEPKKPQQ